NTQLFKPSTIAGLMKKYVYLLEQVNKNPEILLGAVKLVDESIMLSQLEQWNQTSRVLPKENVVSLFESAAIANADRKALTFQSASYSYRLLNESVNQLANYLLSQGVKKGDIVGVILERGPQVLTALLAVLKCGAGYLPIDPEFPQDRISFMLEDSAAP